MQPNNDPSGPDNNKGTILDITQGGYQSVPASPSGSSGGEFHPSPLANPFHFNKKAFLVTTLLIILVSFFGGLAFVLSSRSSDRHDSGNKINNYAVSDLQISQDNTGQIQVGAENLTVNGELQIARTAVITPSETPSKPIIGQIYYDKDANSLYYYNGTKFVNLAQASVTSIDGRSGEITLGEGLQMAGGQLALTPNILDSTSAGALVAGSGINIQGTTITNSGVTSVKGANGLNVSTSDGKVVVSLPQQLATGSSPTFGGLSLSSALGISSGGTGASSYTSGGVIYYNGTRFASTSAPISDGLCLRSSPGGPAFSACPGASSGDGVYVNGATATDANFIDSTATNAVASTTWSLNTATNPDEITLAIGAADATHAGIITATGTQAFGGNKDFNGLLTAKGNLTVETGDNFTINGDAFKDLTGNGLQVTTNTLGLKLESSKGLAVDGNGLSLVDCAVDQVLKYNGSNQWACAADADTDTDTTGITSLTPDDDSITVDSSDPDNPTIAVNLQPGYGLALLDDGIGLTDSCDNGEVLKYNTGTPGWECADDSGSSGLGDDIYVNDSTADNANFIDTSADATNAGTTWGLTADPGNPDQITLAITAADATNAGIVTANAQTFGGDKTFNGLITAEGGVTFGTNDTLTIGGDAFKDLTGNGLQVTTNALNLKLEASKGLAVDSNGLSLIDCSTNEVLKYNGSNQWACAADDTGVGDGEGITSITPDDDSITVTGDSTTAGLSVNLRSDFGLQTYATQGVGLIDTCNNGEVLKYNTTTPGWECGVDSGSSGLGDDVFVNGSAVSNANFLDTTADTTTAGIAWGLNTATDPDDITLAIEAADDTQAGIVTAAAQTFGGDKTFNGLITAEGGITFGTNQNLTIGGDAFKDLTGNGLQVTTNTLNLKVEANKGLAADSNGLSLVDCSNNEILKYSTGTSQWACAADTDTDTDTTGITSLTPDDSLAVDDTDPDNLTISVNLQPNYGLELLSSGIGLTDACDNGEVLKYNTGTPGWECADDSDGSGNSVTLQSAYGNDTDGSDATIALTAADDSIVIQNPASGGTDSSFAFKINQLSTGAVEGLRIESAGSSNLLTVRDTTATAADVFTIADGGDTTVKSQTDSTAAFQVQKSDSTPIFVADTQNSQVAIGPSAVPANGVLTIGTDTTASTGGLYFGTDTNIYRSDSAELTTNSDLVVQGTITGNALRSTSLDTATAAALDIGTTTQNALNIGRSGANTTLAGGNVFLSGNTSVLSGNTFAVQSGWASITGLSSGSNTALRVSNHTSTGSILVLQDAATDVFTVADGGAITAKNSTDSTTAFQIQDSGGTSNLFVADTTNTKIGIGMTPLSGGATLQVSGTINVGTGYRIANAATTGAYLRGNGTNFVSSSLLAADLSGQVSIAHGGTGASSSQGAINAISQLTTNGDILYHNGSNSTRLARGSTGECLTSTATTIQWASCGGSGGGWSLSGNSLSGGEFLGTTNGQNLVLKTNTGGGTYGMLTILGGSSSGTTTITGGSGGGQIFIVEASGGSDLFQVTTNSGISGAFRGSVGGTQACFGGTPNGSSMVEVGGCSSSKAYKHGLEALSAAEYGDILHKIQNTDIFHYYHNTDSPDFQRTGVISEYMPAELTQLDQNGNPTPDWFSVYGYLWAGERELADKTDDLSGRISDVQNSLSQYVQQDQNAVLANLNVSGSIKTLSLQVNGDATFKGSITIAGDATIEGNIIIDGHIVTGGDAPTIEGSTDVTATVEGTDTSGTITVTVSAEKPAGILANLSFNKVFESAPRVTLTPDNESAASVKYYTTDRTTDGFGLSSADTVPAGTYKFSYQDIQ